MTIPGIPYLQSPLQYHEQNLVKWHNLALCRQKRRPSRCHITLVNHLISPYKSKSFSVVFSFKQGKQKRLGNGGTDIPHLSDTLSGACASDIFLLHFLSNIIPKVTKKAPCGAFPSECGVLNIHLIALITVQMFKQCTYTCNSILYHVQTFGK